MIFLFLFLSYLLSILGNLTIIILTLVDPHLKTPMYFSLQNFSFLEVSFTSIFIPRLLTSLTTGNKVISFAGCLTLFFCYTPWGNRVLPPDLYALWPLCGHLQTPALPDHHEQQSLHITCVLLLVRGSPGYLATNYPDKPDGFLCLQYSESVLCDYRLCLEVACSDTSLLELIVIFLAVLTLGVTLWLVTLCYT